MKKLLALFLVPALLFAGEFLGVVPDADPQELMPEFRVVGATRNGLLAVGTDAAFLAGLGGRVLDADATGNRYVLAYPLDEPARALVLGSGRLLDFDGEQYLLRVSPEQETALRQARVMVGRVDLRGWYQAPEPPALPPVLANPLIEAMVARVDPDSVLAVVRRLQEFDNRYSTGDSCRAAADWLKARLDAYGCDTVYFQYHRSGHAPNVIAVRRGTSGRRDKYAIICGHFDSYAPSAAPGADDNASGTAATVEACRVTEGFLFTSDLYFIAWSGEEFGLYGSEAFANAARARGDSIIGVINFDMIGYVDNAPEDCDIMAKIANPPCEPFADWFIAVADSYTVLNCNKRMMSDNQNSDHGPFWDNGYVAVSGIEDFWPTNPHYHTPHDSIGAGYNDNGFCTEVTKAGVAALATLGQPIPLNQPLVGLAGTRLDDSHGNNNGRWDAGEQVDVYLTLRNFGLLDAHSVTATATTADTLITIISGTAQFGDIPGQDSATNTEPFRFRAATGTPREHAAAFSLTITSAETTWQTGFSLVVGPYVTSDPIPDGPRTPPRYWAYEDIDTGYAQTPVYDWIEINSVGTQLAFPHNDDVTGVDLPPEFGPFFFYGQEYTRLSVSADGWICPGDYTQRNYSNRTLPDPQNPPGLLCPNWDDLYPDYNDSGHVYWHHDADNHRFIVEYDSVAYYNPRNVRDKFQVIIYDTCVSTPTGDNDIVMQYATAARFTSSTIGIQDPTRTIGLQLLLNSGLHAGAAPIVPGRAVRYTTVDPAGIAEPGRPLAVGRRRLWLEANPVRRTGRISFSLNREQPVRVSVFDRTGRRLQDLVRPEAGALRPGTHSVAWNAAGLARGIYFIRLSADSETTVKAVLVD